METGEIYTVLYKRLYVKRAETRLERDDGDYSPVERAIREGLRL
jgi:hypothetical protein